MRTFLLAALVLVFSGCVLTTTGVAPGPNGSLWLAGNVSMEGPAMYLCTPQSGELHCNRVPLRGVP